MDNRGSSPVIGALLLIGITIATLSLASTTFFDFTQLSKEPLRASFDTIQIDEGVEVRLNSRGNVDSVTIASSAGTERKIVDVGEVEQVKDGKGTYRIIGKKDDVRQVLETIYVDKSKFGLRVTDTSTNSNDYTVTFERTVGSEKVNFSRFTILPESSRGEIDPANDGVEFGSGGYGSQVDYGSTYSFDTTPSIETGSIAFKTLNNDEQIDSLAVSPSSSYTDMTITVQTEQGDTVSKEFVIDTTVLREDESPYSNVANRNRVIGEDNVSVSDNIENVSSLDLGDNTTVDGNIRNVDSQVQIGDNSYVGDEVKNAGSVKVGDNVTFDDKITGIDSTVSIGENTYVEDEIANVSDNVTIGSDTVLNDGVLDVGTVTFNENVTVEGEVTGIDSTATAYNGVVFENDVTATVNCPDGAGSVTFEQSGSCS